LLIGYYPKNLKFIQLWNILLKLKNFIQQNLSRIKNLTIYGDVRTASCAMKNNLNKINKLFLFTINDFLKKIKRFLIFKFYNNYFLINFLFNYFLFLALLYFKLGTHFLKICKLKNSKIWKKPFQDPLYFFEWFDHRKAALCNKTDFCWQFLKKKPSDSTGDVQLLELQ
jgi:hypothetical protein